MSAQPEALRLADALAAWEWSSDGRCGKAAAELRRLHGLDFALRNCELALQKMATKYMDAVDQCDALMEANEAFSKREHWWNEKMFTLEQQRDALMEALKEHEPKGGGNLPPPLQAELVAVHQFRKQYCANWYDGHPDHTDGGGPYEERTLYTTPSRREWQSLSEEDMEDLLPLYSDPSANTEMLEFAAAIEAKLKEKNA